MMSNTPLISIIVPVYNVEKYLSKCIESILHQTYKNFELILVDDGTPDNSGKICDEYALKDSRIKVFHKANGGVSSARNLGIDKAEGEWVTFVDADDYLLSEFLEGLYTPIKQGENVDFVHGGCVNVKNEEFDSINQSYEYYIGDNKTLLLQRLRGLVISKLFRLDKIRHRPEGIILYFDEKMRIAEDMAFTLDYALYVNRFALVSETGYCYRIDNMQSATKSKKVYPYEISLAEFKHLYSSIFKYIDVHKISDKDAQIRKSQLANKLMLVISNLYLNKLPKKERLSHLKNDFNDKEIKLLPYARIPLVKKIIFNFYRMKFYSLFDFIMYIVYRNR